MDISILEDLGLTPAEIKTYIALLELGSSTAGPILEKSGLQNSVTHRSLHSLIQKGLIHYILEGRRKVYQATDPENFFNFIDDKKERFAKLLPDLKQKQLLAKQKKQASLYHGKRGINEIYNKLIHSNGEEYNTFGGGKRVTFDVMGSTWWRNFHAKRISLGLPSRQIFDETLKSFGKELNRKKLTRIRFLPQEFEQLTETVIVGNLVAINIFTENPYGVLIEDSTVVAGYKKYFEVLWDKASTL